ncbi:MAG: nitroreductase, partial [Bacteroidales bacterium]|nr:nitroreductase [Bacteroidales bacterium]
MKKLYILVLVILSTFFVSCSNQSNKESNDMKTTNAVIENIMQRRSIRNYKDSQVPKDILDKIVECGINAPNAINRQAWEVRVINNPESFSLFKEYLVKDNSDTPKEMIEGCFRGAPTLIVIANDTSFKFSQIDCGLLSENIMLSAWSLGIGSVCLGSPVGFINNSQQVKNMLGFSEGYSTVICIGLGYANENP